MLELEQEKREMKRDEKSLGPGVINSCRGKRKPLDLNFIGQASLVPGKLTVELKPWKICNTASWNQGNLRFTILGQ